MAALCTGASSTWVRVSRWRSRRAQQAVCKSATASSRSMAKAQAPALRSEAGAYPEASMRAGIARGCKIISDLPDSMCGD
jgi:hypothetical protein